MADIKIQGTFRSDNLNKKIADASEIKYNDTALMDSNGKINTELIPGSIESIISYYFIKVVAVGTLPTTSSTLQVGDYGLELSTPVGSNYPGKLRKVINVSG